MLDTTQTEASVNLPDPAEVVRSYKFKLYRADRNKHLHRKIDVAGMLWNHMIRYHRRYYGMFGKHLTAYTLQKRLTQIKKRRRYDYYREVSCNALQGVIERIDAAYTLFFRNIKRGIKASPPKFKPVRFYASVTYKRSGWKLLGDGRLRIQKRDYRFHASRPIPENIRTVTIKRDRAGDLWVVFVCKLEVQPPAVNPARMVGVDFGIRTFMVFSDGREVHAPLPLQQSLDALKKANRAVAKKEKGSGNRDRALKDRARIYRTVENQRRDWHYKLAHELLAAYDVLIFEDLCIKGMGRLFGKKIGDLGFAAFMEKLTYMAAERGVTVHKINRFYPSSKLCSVCGFKYDGLTLSEREWTCRDCGTTHLRDQNAALNILREGASSLGLGDVRECGGATRLDLRSLSEPTISCCKAESRSTGTFHAG